MTKNKLNKKGLTLIEIIITLAIFAIIIQVVYSIFFVGNKSFNVGKNTGFAQQEIRNASIALSKEIKMAKDISNTDIYDKSIIVEDINDEGETSSYLKINNLTFGPFKETSFNISSFNKTLEIILIDKLESNIQETISVYFENWDNFTSKDDLSSIKILYYTKY